MLKEQDESVTTDMTMSGPGEPHLHLQSSRSLAGRGHFFST